MGPSETIPTSVSSLVGRSVVDAAGRTCGHVHEFAVDVAHDGSRVLVLVLQTQRGGKGASTMVPVDSVHLPSANAGPLRTDAEPEHLSNLNDFLLLERDLLDQQIIDVDGRKVVRVNDVNLAWSTDPEGDGRSALMIEEVEVGVRGASRRLLKGLPNLAVDRIAANFKPRTIPWSCVDLIERDPARRVRLKIGQERLQKLHPSDIAEILEDLAPAEREAVFTSLPEETAAEALEEIDPKLQKELLQGLASERAADIIEEMDPAAAADLLGELSDEESEAILEEMEPEERQDVEELLEFSSNSAAGQMTTDFVSVGLAATVEEAVEALRTFEGDADTITEVYLLDPEDTLKAVVTLPKLLMARREAKLSELSEGHIVSCGVHASEKEVAGLFDKYNLRSLPVVNQHGHIAGVIHAEQVIAQLLER